MQFIHLDKVCRVFCSNNETWKYSQTYFLCSNAYVVINLQHVRPKNTKQKNQKHCFSRREGISLAVVREALWRESLSAFLLLTLESAHIPWRCGNNLYNAEHVRRQS